MANVDDQARGANTPGLGQLLRTHRRRAGLTQQALAQLATVSSRTIRDLELGRVQARARTVRLIADGLGLLGLSREAFLDAGQPTAHPRGPGPSLDTEPPYPADSLLGRDSEVWTLGQELESRRRRAIVVLGLGGVGKSRMVLEVAQRLHRQRKWPVLWVTFGPCPRREAGGLVREVRALLETSTPDSSRLCRLIGEHDVLMVLDDVADLTPALSWLVHDLLGSCPGLRIVVTSRGVLTVPGAQPAVVGPLPIPPEDYPTLTASELTGIPSVELLVERLASVQPGWLPTPPELGPIARLCRRLDGLPVALEIVAHQYAVLSLEELASAPAGELLRFCAPAAVTGESTSLWELLGGSCQLLSDAERADLRALATLDGSWRVNDAGAMLGRPWAEVVNLLGRLTRLGMVRRLYDGQGFRFELLNLVREFLAASPVVASPVR